MRFRICRMCRIPAGTSPELTVLLQGLLRRNARERIEFDDFFNHAFIRKTARQPTTPVRPPLPPPHLILIKLNC